MKLHSIKISKSLRRLLTAGIIAAGCSTASAAFITITSGNPGNQGTENVLFNDSSLLLSGPLVQGTFSGSGSGYIVDFTSTSGSGLLSANGGQASIEGGTGNDPFTCLTFGLEDGATFTKAILNPDVLDSSGDGTIDFTVSYLSGDGSPFMQSFSVNSNGSNFFGIEAGMGAVITEVTFCSTNTAFADANQFRLGGFAAGSRVPDGGATFALLGISLIGLASARKMIGPKV